MSSLTIVLRNRNADEVLSALAKIHGAETILEKAMEIVDSKPTHPKKRDGRAGRRLGLNVKENAKYLAKHAGLDKLVWERKNATDEEIFEANRAITGKSFQQMYAVCPWDDARIADARGVKAESVYTERSKGRTALRILHNLA